jgi:signal transduction histidine kinase
MANLTRETDAPETRSLPEALVRSLRHEVGDLLQKVYASVAILKDRLPADRELERGVLTRLWSRAETCKHVLDAVHDFICSVSLDLQPVDLTQVADALVKSAQARLPHLQVVTEASGAAPVLADPRRVAQIGELLLCNACEAAQSRVCYRTTTEPDRHEVVWSITDDGPGIPPDQANWLFSPFFTTRAGHTGLGLALAQKLVQLHGGRVSAGNLPRGGFQAQVTFPAEVRAREE